MVLSPFAHVVVACVLVAAASRLTAADTVTLSNVKVPVDTDGNKLITGEADILYVPSDVTAVATGYYLYFNNWGTCPGVNCCDSSAGCATCCFNSPPHPYLPGCGNLTNGSDPYGLYHTFQVYHTEDFTSFKNLGIALSLENRKPGIAFRPHVVYNPTSEKFVMWFEDRADGLKGYTVVTSDSPAGPFKDAIYNVVLPGSGRTGDFDVFVDDDGKAYHIRTGFDVVQLDDNFTGPAQHMSSFNTPKASEGPVVFKRMGKYYVLAGTGCCACIGGSTIYVEMADSLAGPWKYFGDVGSNPTPFDPHSPNNYVTKAQASAVTVVDNDKYLWLGNQWNSGLSETPPGPRNHDLLYWSILNFNDTDGSITQFQYQESISFDTH